MPEKRAKLSVNFGFPKLVQVSEELKDMSATAAREGEGWPVILEILAKSVPISTLLVLVSA